MVTVTVIVSVNVPVMDVVIVRVTAIAPQMAKEAPSVSGDGDGS
ncbi:MAG: hypothetical protein ACFFB2_17295 [Promethearchaeota archaeon]